MRTKRQWLSILLVLAMVAGALGFGGVKSVSADNGKITNVQISKDYILTWDAVEGAETYTLQLPREWGSSKTNSFDIGAHFCKLGMPDGNYNVYITAYGKVNGETKSLAGSGFFYFDYVSPLPKLSTPQNIRLEGDELVWDPVKSMTDDEVKYKIDHRCIGGMSHGITETIKTTKTRIPVTEFTQHGTHDYEISIRAYAENHQDSDKGEKTISITRNLPALQNVDFTKGVLSWDEPEFDNLSYYIYVSSSGSATGTNAPSIDYYNGRCYWDVSSYAKKHFANDGMNVKVFIVGFEYVNELERVASVQTQAVNLDYVVQTEVYPLKFMGKQLSSADKVINGYWIHYFPSINTLDFDNANLWAIQITGYPHEAVFESDQDLVIDGQSTLEWDKPMFKVNGQLTFAENSEMTINSGGYAVSADKILFNGKNLNVSAKNDDALFAKSAIKIGMTDQSVNVATTYGYSAFTCTKGKITLDRMHIETPEKGTLGKDAKHIYESDGRTAAEVVELVQATPTPTNSPKPTGATPKPTGATPKPTGATPKPTGATPKPTGATPKPTGATPKPTGATPKPTGATPKPTGATPKPTGATPKPTGATPKPTGATPKPTGATPKPTGATPKPTGATPKPTGATPKPTGATPKPTGATPKPTGATPKPTGATPKPTGATPKPGDPTPDPEKEPSIADFVERLYTIALARESEPEGKAFWVNEIESGNRTGGDCAHFFLIEAPEFLNRGLNEEDFVETLYLTFFDRASEAAGKKFWVDGLKSGKLTKENVIMGFIDSTEWCNVCATYGVKSGAPNAKAEFASKNAIKFATRLYTCCLGREPEEGGLKYWSLALTNLEQTGYAAAEQFFTGAEFVNLNLKDDEYVRRLYTTFMGREPEASEVAYWTGELAKGSQTRTSTMQFFGHSEEFTNICKQYGIDRG